MYTTQNPVSIVLSLLLGIVSSQSFNNRHVCTSVTIPMCLEMPYNATRMPNLLLHRTQEEAAIMAHEFLPLVDIGCSPYVRFFICSVFAPMCTEKVSFGVPSCRSVCYAVKETCLPVLRRLNFSWPPFLHCGSFPEEGLCMMPPDLKMKHGSNVEDTSLSFSQAISKPTPFPKWQIDLHQRTFDQICVGARDWVPTDEKNGICTPICDKDFLFKGDDKNVATAWAASWAFVCLLSTSFSLITFCLDSNRFKYPERPVIYLALSYFCFSIPFITRLFLPASLLSCETDHSTGVRHLATSGISSSGCIITFIIQYYFSFASDIWWTILTFCWFMSSWRFWGSEGLSSYSPYFHAVAWGIPALASVTAITLRQVDGDELTGMCFVGNLRPKSLFYFVILPQGLLLASGTVFILLGFIAMFGIRNAFRKQVRMENAVTPSCDILSSNLHVSDSSHTHAHLGKLERLMIRLGVFSVLSTLPALFVLGCHLHSHMKYPEWVEKAVQLASVCENGRSSASCMPRQSMPAVEISLLRIFMSMVVGVTSGVWVWSPKTISLWKRSIRGLFIVNHVSLWKSSTPPRPVINIGSSELEASAHINAISNYQGVVSMPLLGTYSSHPQELNTLTNIEISTAFSFV